MVITHAYISRVYARSFQLVSCSSSQGRSTGKQVNPGSSPAQAMLKFSISIFFTKYDITTHPVHITNDMDRVIMPSKTHYFSTINIILHYIGSTSPCLLTKNAGICVLMKNICIKQSLQTSYNMSIRIQTLPCILSKQKQVQSENEVKYA